MMTKEQIKEDGKPETALKFRKKNPAILILISSILVILFCLFLHNKTAKKEVPLLEETYSVQTQSIVENNIPVTKPEDDSKRVITQEQIALVREKQIELQQRLSAPLMIVNNNSQSSKSEISTQATPSSTDRNTQFLEQVSAQNSETATVKKLGSLNSIIAEGSLIHAILESATHSDLPGYVRAVVSEPNYSEDGTQILIPRGSRLIGQYKSGILQGQSRIFLVWTRLITPSGISIQLGSPGVDSLGVAGIGADEINRHFWERFGTASLLSILGAGTANIGVTGADQDNSASAYRTAVANSFSQSADQSLQQDSKIPPTLQTYQGKPIIVFVAKDLNFNGFYRAQNSRNI